MNRTRSRLLMAVAAALIALLMMSTTGYRARISAQSPTLQATQEVAVTPDPASLIGIYSVAVVPASGRVTQGKLTITKETVQYRLGWTIEDAQVKGIGFLREDVFAAVLGPATCQLALYKPDKSGNLYGIWSTVGSGDVKTLGTETVLRAPNATPAADGKLTGPYQFKRTYPDAQQSDYIGSFTLNEMDDYLTITWPTTKPLSVTGLRDDVWIATVGDTAKSTGCGVALFRVLEDRTMEGQYIVLGETEVGTISAAPIGK